MKKILSIILLIFALTVMCITVSAREFSRSDVIYEGFENTTGGFYNYGATCSYTDGVLGKALVLGNVYKYATVKLDTVMGINRAYRVSYYVKGISNFENKQLTMIVQRKDLHKNSLGETAQNPVERTYHYLGNTILTDSWQKVELTVKDEKLSITDEIGNCVVYPVVYKEGGVSSGVIDSISDGVSYAIDEFTIEPLEIINEGDFSNGQGNFLNNTKLSNMYVSSENGNKILTFNAFSNPAVGQTEKSIYYHPNLEEGKRYKLTFRAKTASGNNTLKIIFSRVGDGFAQGTTTGTRYQNLSDAVLTEEWQVFSRTFATPSEANTAYRYPKFILRTTSVGTVYFDDISIREIGTDISNIVPSGKAAAGENVNISFDDTQTTGTGYEWKIVDCGNKQEIQSGTTINRSFSFTVPDCEKIAVAINRVNPDGTKSEARILTIDEIEKSDYIIEKISDKQEIAAIFTDTVWSPDFKTVRGQINVKNISGYIRGFMAVYGSDEKLLRINSSVLKEGINRYEISAEGGAYAKLFAFGDNQRPLIPAEILYRDTSSEFIYVDYEKGKTTNPGTYDAPVKQISVAYNKISLRGIADDKNVYIMIKAADNAYTTPVEITGNLRSGNICYAGYGGENGKLPVLSGGTEITGWTLYDEEKNIYRALVKSSDSTNFRQIYINGNRGIRARSETIPKMKEITDTGYVFYDVNMPRLSKPEDAEFVYHFKWTNPRCGIKSISAGSMGIVTVDMDDYCWDLLKNKKHLEPTNGPAYIENAIEFVDMPGEWFYDKSDKYLYYIPRSFENMETAEITVPVNENLVTVTGSASNKIKNITFRNIEFAYSNWTYPDDYGYSDAQSGRIRDHGDKIPGAAVNVKYADNVNFEGCKFVNLGMSGLAMLEGITNSHITGNEFSNLAGSGMYIGNVSDTSNATQYVTIDNNYIHDIGLDYKSCVGIATLWVKDTDVIHNEIFDVPYSAIHGGAGATSDITNLNYNDNFISRCLNAELYDGGALYHTGATSGTKENPNCMRGNYIKEQMNDHGALYPDNNAKGWYMCDNVIDLSMVESWRSGKICWLLSNPAEENYADNNYTTTEMFQINSGMLTNPNTDPGVTITNTRVYPDADWPSEAQQIIDNAGLSQKYSALLIPEYKITKSAYGTLNIPLGMTKNLALFGEGGKNGRFNAADVKYIVNHSPELFEVNGTDVTATNAGCGYVTIYSYSGKTLKKLDLTINIK